MSETNERRILSVTQVNMYVRSLLESSVHLNDLWIMGEISNFTDHYKSGHLYMSLKDENALIKAVMFRQYAAKLQFKPQSGMRVLCRGRVSLYERDGQYQLYVTEMQPAGAGALAVAFEQMKEKRKTQGSFDQGSKRPIPRFPGRIAVITSETGAAVQDILNILSRRYPVAQVVLCPVQVQGDAAAPQMVQALRQVNERRCADVIIIGRGGGSMEDLWAFNDENLARVVVASEIPVISAVGHETDFTICDFVADLRAPTPSAAAELAVPDQAELKNRLYAAQYTLGALLKRQYTQKQTQLQTLLQKQCMRDPLFLVDRRRQDTDLLLMRMKTAFQQQIERWKTMFSTEASRLAAMNPLSVLLRGYAVVTKQGQIVSQAAGLRGGDRVKIKLHDGEKSAIITEEPTNGNEG